MQANRFSLLIYLARSQLESRHAGSIGGIAWLFLAPIALIATIWVAIDLGLGMRKLSGPEYSLMLVVGLLAWLPFSDSIGDAVHAVLRVPHLVKKMVFPVEILPIASALAAFAVHVVLLLAVIILFSFIGKLSLPGLIALPFWLLLSFAFASALALIGAGLNVIVRDIGTLFPFLTGILFWLTPVVWPMKNIPQDWLWIISINPMAVVLEGYRSAILATPFPFEIGQVALSVGITAALLFAGYALFNALKPSFADAI
jgi:ABC-type polysaccharide/polyol phosphate export permease